MSNTLIERYKPYYINDFNLEEDIREILKTLLELDSLNVLLIGNSNSGKTTMLHAIIREYYGLSKKAKLSDLIKCVRADEMHHSTVNHSYADDFDDMKDNSKTKKPALKNIERNKIA